MIFSATYGVCFGSLNGRFRPSWSSSVEMNEWLDSKIFFGGMVHNRSALSTPESGELLHPQSGIALACGDLRRGVSAGSHRVDY